MTIASSGPVNTSIEQVWDRLNDCFGNVYSIVLRHTPTVQWLAEAHANSNFPLMAYARYDRKHCPSDDSLVLSVDLHRRDGLITWTTDITTDGGRVMAVGPARYSPEAEPLSSWIGEAADAAIAWFHAETPNFIAYLNQEPTPYDVD